MIPNEAVADVLERAADLYESEQYEWCAGYFTNWTDNGGVFVCATEALRLACGETLQTVSGRKTPRRMEDHDRVLYSRTLQELGFGTESNLVSWNDEATFIAKEGDLLTPKYIRTKAEVIELFKNKAKELRNES